MGYNGLKLKTYVIRRSMNPVAIVYERISCVDIEILNWTCAINNIIYMVINSDVIKIVWIWLYWMWVDNV